MNDMRIGVGLCVAALAALAGCGGAGDDAGVGGSAARDEAGVEVASGRDGACAPDGELAYICGLANAEDIVAVGDTGWLVASSINRLGAPPGPGRMYLIDAAGRTARELFPGASPELRHDQAMYPDCPAPLDLDAFDTHGLAVRERSPGVYRLYATSHGAIEAIQAFELDVRGEEPAAAWVGCVPLPDDVWANSVAIRQDGGFVTTKFMSDPGDPEGFPRILAGEINGEVYEWSPGSTVTAIEGTELSGANGIELSPDGRFLYVAAFGGREVARYDLGASPPAKTTVSVDINPDNLRWTPDGALLTVGGDLTAGNTGGWSIYRIDPQSMEAAVIGGADGSAALQGAATALEVDGEIWIGTYNGDRVGVLRAR